MLKIIVKADRLGRLGTWVRVSCVGFLAGRLWGRDRRPGVGGRGHGTATGVRCGARTRDGVLSGETAVVVAGREEKASGQSIGAGGRQGSSKRGGLLRRPDPGRRPAGPGSRPGSGWCWSPAADQHDATAGVEPAPAEAEAMLDGVTPLDRPTDPGTGETAPITPVTDNGGPFRPFRSGHVITAHPEPGHVRTRVRTPGHNGVRARARLPVAEA